MLSGSGLRRFCVVMVLCEAGSDLSHTIHKSLSRAGIDNVSGCGGVLVVRGTYDFCGRTFGLVMDSLAWLARIHRGLHLGLAGLATEEVFLRQQRQRMSQDTVSGCASISVKTACTAGFDTCVFANAAPLAIQALQKLLSVLEADEVGLPERLLVKGPLFESPTTATPQFAHAGCVDIRKCTQLKNLSKRKIEK